MISRKMHPQPPLSPASAILTCTMVQVNLLQKHLFLHQLTHNATKDWITSSVHENCKLRTSWEHVVWINCFFVFVLTFRTIYVHIIFSTCSELCVFIYWTGKSMNNLLSYCGLVDARIRASNKDLPVSL